MSGKMTSETEVDMMFSKKFKFKEVQLTSSVQLDLSWMAHKLLTLTEMKESLNGTKNLLKNKDIHSWHLHTSNTNRAKAVFSKIKQTIRPELLTQAWLKFYECLSQYDLVAMGTSGSQPGLIFESLHLCEAPGAFIAALNHFLTVNHKGIQFQWTATTLNPHFEGNSSKFMIDDDRFIIHTLNNWTFGTDDTGNIMNWNNVKDLIERMGGHDVGLITADGSIDCMDDPRNQEEDVARLLWCETIAALSILKNGGSFVLKVFTLFESATISLLYLLRISFGELHAFKPCTSKEGNSEIYLIATHYRKTEENLLILNLFKVHVYDEGKDLKQAGLLHTLPKISQQFLDEVVECARLFKNYQEEAILRNLALYNLPSGANEMHELQEKVARRFMEKFCLKKMPQAKCIVRPRLLQIPEWKIQLMSTANRTTLLLMPKNSTEWMRLKQELIEINLMLVEHSVLFWEPSDRNQWSDNVLLITGKSYQKILSSKFCHLRVFHVFKHLNEKFTENDENPSRGDNETTMLLERTFENAFLQVKQNALLNRFLDQVGLCGSVHMNGTDFEIEQIPLLSRFAVASLWIIAHFFLKVEFHFTENPKICFINYQENEKILDWIRGIDLSFLNIICIEQLCSDPFYSIIFRYNSFLLSKYSLLIMEDNSNLFSPSRLW